MPVNSRHPEYDIHIADWIMLRDTIAGDRLVKDRAKTYLPMPSGFEAAPEGPEEAYKNYKFRAQFPRLVSPTLRGMLGVIHRKASDVTLPKALEPMLEKATPDGASLEVLHKRISFELLATGRYCLFVDAEEDGSDVPYIAGYDAEHLINWSRFGDFFVFDESSIRRNGYVWAQYNKYRVLEYSYDIDPNDPTKETATKTYKVKVFDGTMNEAEPELIIPTRKGGEVWDEIPCVVIGSTDVRIDIDEMPLLGVAQAALAAYRLDADYRHQLYMTGQETLVLTKCSPENKPRVIGAGVCLTLPEGADAKYVGPSGTGIAAHKEAIAEEFSRAAAAGARLFDSSERAAESGDALRIRFAGQTATLTSIAISSAQGLEKALKYAAMMVGANPDEVEVKPNLSFVDSTLTGQDALAIMQLWQGRAISKQTMYETLQRGEVASTARTFEDEQGLIEDEVPPPSVIPLPPGPAPTDGQLNAMRSGKPAKSLNQKASPAPRPGKRQFFAGSKGKSGAADNAARQ